MILFKDSRLKEEFESTPLLLQLITKDLAHFCETTFNKDVIITRVLEKIEGSSGVHEDSRAVDIRNQHDEKFFFTELEIAPMLDYLNNKYYRNDGKPTAIHHSFCGGPLHIHIQIADSVKAYMKEKPNG